MKKQSVWRHKKKFKGQDFSGHYIFHSGDRNFELASVSGRRRVSFESHEAAKRDGWYKVR